MAEARQRARCFGCICVCDGVWQSRFGPSICRHALVGLARRDHGQESPAVGGIWRDGCDDGILGRATATMLGTQLSFVATASLLSLQGKGIWWRVPVRAQMGTLALTTRAFDAFPLLFYPVNVIAGGIMLILGMCCLGALVGIPWFNEAADVFAATTLDCAHEVSTGFNSPCAIAGFQGEQGFFGCPNLDALAHQAHNVPFSSERSLAGRLFDGWTCLFDPDLG